MYLLLSLMFGLMPLREMPAEKEKYGIEIKEAELNIAAISNKTEPTE